MGWDGVGLVVAGGRTCPAAWVVVSGAWLGRVVVCGVCCHVPLLVIAGCRSSWFVVLQSVLLLLCSLALSCAGLRHSSAAPFVRCVYYRSTDSPRA